MRMAGDTTALGATASTRASVAAVAGVCAGVLVGLPGSWQIGTLAGWDLAAGVYVAWTWATIWHRDPVATARLALREDPGRAVADALLLVASMASVALSWTVVQTLFTLHYARLYYTHPAGGIDFNQEAPPRYADFAYLAFTVGMTFQVSDTALGSSALRAATLRQALLSYLLGAVILATTINLVAGLLR
jgi:uncharacterized membrane protein